MYMMLNPQIIFEDDFLIAIEKPSGVVVNSAESVSGETIEDWIRARGEVGSRKLDREKNLFIERAGIVHRLDRETSGILLIAKNEAVFEKMTALFKNREVHKKYFALVHGEIEPSGMLNFKIARHDKKGKFVVTEGIKGVEGRGGIAGKDALTEYKLISRYLFNEESLNDFLRNNFNRLKDKYDLKNYSLAEIKLHTGRTHQIRVHFSYVHHPVAGDKLYGLRKAVKFEKLWCPRQFLHAAEIRFAHPVTGEEIVLNSELPVDLKAILKQYLILNTA